MPDGAAATMKERLRALADAHHARFMEETPELSPDELEKQHQAMARDKHRQALREGTARPKYRPRPNMEEHAKAIQSLPLWYVLQIKPNISPAELRVLAVLRLRARPDRPRVRIARSELAKVAKVSDRHVLRCLYELRDAGFIKPWAEVRISRALSDVNLYELEADSCWPRVADQPADKTRQIRRARYDMNDTPSGCPTDTIRSAPDPETPEGGGRDPESGRAPPGGVARPREFAGGRAGARPSARRGPNAQAPCQPGDGGASPGERCPARPERHRPRGDDCLELNLGASP